jgi:hypothetical protein
MAFESGVTSVGSSAHHFLTVAVLLVLVACVGLFVAALVLETWRSFRMASRQRRFSSGPWKELAAPQTMNPLRADPGGGSTAGHAMEEGPDAVSVRALSRLRPDDQVVAPPVVPPMPSAPPLPAPPPVADDGALPRRMLLYRADHPSRVVRSTAMPARAVVVASMLSAGGYDAGKSSPPARTPSLETDE